MAARKKSLYAQASEACDMIAQYWISSVFPKHGGVRSVPTWPSVTLCDPVAVSFGTLIETGMSHHQIIDRKIAIQKIRTTFAEDLGRAMRALFPEQEMTIHIINTQVQIVFLNQIVLDCARTTFAKHLRILHRRWSPATPGKKHWVLFPAAQFGTGTTEASVQSVFAETISDAIHNQALLNASLGDRANSTGESLALRIPHGAGHAEICVEAKTRAMTLLSRAEAVPIPQELQDAHDVCTSFFQDVKAGMGDLPAFQTEMVLTPGKSPEITHDSVVAITETDAGNIRKIIADIAETAADFARVFFRYCPDGDPCITVSGNMYRVHLSIEINSNTREDLPKAWTHGVATTLAKSQNAEEIYIIKVNPDNKSRATDLASYIHVRATNAAHACVKAFDRLRSKGSRTLLRGIPDETSKVQAMDVDVYRVTPLNRAEILEATARARQKLDA